jgi:hypothetical protein
MVLLSDVRTKRKIYELSSDNHKHFLNVTMPTSSSATSFTSHLDRDRGRPWQALIMAAEDRGPGYENR